MNLKILSKELIFDEGIKLVPYFCTKKKLSIGVGRNLKANGLTKAEREYLNYHETGYQNLVLSREQAMYLLFNDIANSVTDLRHIFKDFDTFSDELQHILINLMHQLGYSSFSGFRDMIRAIKRKDFKDAAAELRDSVLWREDTPEDAERLAKRFEKVKG